MLRRNSFLAGLVICLVSSGFAVAQGMGGQDRERQGFGGAPPMEHAFHDGQFRRWWNDPRVAQQLNLTDQQKHQMEDIFLQHRLKLIDLNANLEKQETLLHPMIEADQPDEGKILSQIDAVAQARADLEKANARMLFDLRKTLTPDQWHKLQAMREEHRAEMTRRGPGDGRGGPGMWRQRHPSGPGGPGDPGDGGPGAPPQGQPPAPQGSGPDAQSPAPQE